MSAIARRVDVTLARTLPCDLGYGRRDRVASALDTPCEHTMWTAARLVVDRAASSAARRANGRAPLVLLLLVLVGCEARPILLWHNVGEPVDPPRWVTRESFEAQLDLILGEGFTPMTATELDAIELDGQPGPPHPIVLTFDDGYANFYRHAYPALRARGLPATMFLIAARVGEDEASRVRDERGDFLIWPEVRAMQADGIDFQSHSVSHRNLKHLSDDEVRAELQESRRQLEAGLGRPVTVLAYPFGGNSPHTQALVEDAGYRSAHSVMAGMGGDFARLRTSVGQRTSLDDLRAALRGSWFGETSDLR